MIRFLSLQHKKLIFFVIIFLPSIIFSMENNKASIKSLRQLCAETLADELIKKLQKSPDKLECIRRHNLLLDTPHLLPEHLDNLIGQTLFNKHPKLVALLQEKLPIKITKLPTDFVYETSFSGNGSRLAILNTNNNIQIIDSKNTTILTNIEENIDKPIHHFCLNENGSLLAIQLYAAKNHECIIRDIDTGQVKKKFSYNYINHTTFDHLGIYFALIFNDTKIDLFKIEDWIHAGTLEILCPETYGAEINSVAFTSDSKLIAATRKHLHIFDLTDLHKQPVQIKVHGKKPLLSPNGLFYSSILIEKGCLFNQFHLAISTINNSEDCSILSNINPSLFDERIFSKDGSLFASEENETKSFKLWNSNSTSGFNGKKIDRMYHVSINHDGTQLCGKTKYGPAIIDLKENFDSLYNNLTIRKSLLLIGLYENKQFPVEEFMQMVTNKKGRSIIKKLYRSFNPAVQEELLKHANENIEIKKDTKAKSYLRVQKWIKNILKNVC